MFTKHCLPCLYVCFVFGQRDPRTRSNAKPCIHVKTRPLSDREKCLAYDDQKNHIGMYISEWDLHGTRMLLLFSRLLRSTRFNDTWVLQPPSRGLCLASLLFWLIFLSDRIAGWTSACGSDPACDIHCGCLIFMIDAQTVSYTHLTLPTNREV